MDSSARLQEFNELQSVCLSLEEQTGISKAMERAREGRFIPLGALGEDVSSEEYFADEYDHLRQRTRDAYFSVEDVELRRKLIAARRAVESNIRQTLEEEIIAANRNIADAAAKVQHLPWNLVALLAIAIVVVGYWKFEIIGAIAGVAASFFLGQGVIERARNRATSVLAEAHNDLAQAKKEWEEHSLEPNFFSRSEELSGERDSKFNQESAYAKVLQKSANG